MGHEGICRSLSSSVCNAQLRKICVGAMSNAPHSHRRLADGRLDLPEVTLVAAAGKALPATIRALRKCLAQVRPADVILFSDTVSPGGDLTDIRYVRIGKMESREAYSSFILKELTSYIETDFVLCVQWDGYILNAQSWSDDFLTVDYIGAPWPQFGDAYDVGNGGFSLRSRRLLQACADERISGSDAEDIVICRQSRPWLESDYGIRFADRDLASRFAFERTIAQGGEFGFHGAFNMADVMPRSEFRKIIASLDARVLRRADIIELLKGAFMQRDFRMVGILLNSMLDAGSGQTRLDVQELSAASGKPQHLMLTTRKIYGG
jgi:hypothetical protein